MFKWQKKFGGGKISRGTLIKISKSPFLKESERPLKIHFGKILLFDMFLEVPNIHWESLICFPFKYISLLYGHQKGYNFGKIKN